MRDNYNIFINSVLAGMMIGFGGIVYLMCPNKIVGSILFSFGLLTIVCRGFSLYTGKVGYVKSYGIVNILVTILGNFIGTYIIGKLFAITRHTTNIQEIVSPKLQDTSLSIFLLSVCCGAMMYLAVDSYKITKSWLFVIFPIVVFILSGFEHSIANMFYISLADQWQNNDSLRITLLAIVGNAAGSWMINSNNFHCK